MPGQSVNLSSFLGGLYLFSGLNEQQVIQVARDFSLITLVDGQQLSGQSNLGNSFFILLEGKVIARRRTQSGMHVDETLVPGDFFGEETLYNGEAVEISILASKKARLLRIDLGRFSKLLRKFPIIHKNLRRTMESRRLAQTVRFDWLHTDEQVYRVSRKHDTYLLVSLAGPFLLGIISVLIIFFISTPDAAPTTWLIGVLVSLFSFGLSMIWGGWNYIDWSNDYYIITNQRVVWVEHVIWLYNSREEAPLTTIRSVDVKTNILGRILGYGDVMVNTYTGRIVLSTVGQPFLMAATIEEYWHRAQSRSEEEEDQALEDALRRKLDLANEPEEDLLDLQSEPPRVKQADERGSLFGNFFKMRFEQGSVITYRKFWLVLLKKGWKPTLAITVLFTVLGVSLILSLLNILPGLNLWVVFLLGGIVFLFGLLPWWVYHYIDWRNDIYQVSDRYIFDIERRPFGTEIKKSAPLENILSLEHERIGFLGYLFNYGNVTIYVGDARFQFQGIHDPARAQQDVFNHMYALRRKRELVEAARQRERIASALSMYREKFDEESGDVG
jgi:hypothetical protein